MVLSLLRSGSCGNCTYIEHDQTRVLLDAGGMSRKKITALLEEISVCPESISAVLITHLHCDHINKATLSFCKSFSVPLWIHQSSVALLHTIFPEKYLDGVTLNSFCTQRFGIGDIVFESFLLPHDAAGVTNGFVFWAFGQDNESRVGYAADCGHLPESVIKVLSDVKILCIEANHDTGLLWNNQRRGRSHKKRVTGKRGHLSNIQSGEAILSVIGSSFRPPLKVVLCHLSEDHNSAGLAIKQVGALVSAHFSDIELIAAHRDRRTPWLDPCHAGEPLSYQLSLPF